MSLTVWTDDGGLAPLRWTMPAVPRVGENLMLGVIQYVVEDVIWEMHNHELSQRSRMREPLIIAEWEPRLKIERVT